MRKIQFRGLRTDGKGWVYGCLINWHPSLNPRIIGSKENSSYDDGLEETNFEIKPESIGQFIGLKDKNGKEYYFNDIVKTVLGIGVLVWFDDQLGISSGEINDYHATDSIRKEELEHSEIIGNIFDNPKIL